MRLAVTFSFSLHRSEHSSRNAIRRVFARRWRVLFGRAKRVLGERVILNGVVCWKRVYGKMGKKKNGKRKGSGRWHRARKRRATRAGKDPSGGVGITRVWKCFAISKSGVCLLVCAKARYRKPPTGGLRTAHFGVRRKSGLRFRRVTRIKNARRTRASPNADVMRPSSSLFFSLHPANE